MPFSSHDSPMKGKYIVIRDEHSKLFGHRFLNSQLSLYLGFVQLLVCLWALIQHIWAMASLNKVPLNWTRVIIKFC